MTALQTRVSRQFLTAMGPMIEEENKLKAVLEYIETLKTGHVNTQIMSPCTLDEFSDMMAQDLGQRYGLNDIREAI